jgi:hypothetical protein
MKTFSILLTFSLTGSSLFLLGCSKSKKLEPQANSNSPANSSANGGSAAAGPVDLTIKWQAGKQYDMEMDLKQSLDINAPNRPVHQELKLTQGLQYSPLKDLDDGRHQLEMEFESQDFEFTQNGRKMMSYDTTQNAPVETNSAAAPVAAVLRAMLGVSLDYTIAADGTVEKIDGINSLMNRITAALPNQRQRASLQQLFDQNTLNQYGSFSQSLPGHPVNIGDSWSSTHDINNNIGVLTVNTTYTFKDWQQHDGHNCAHLLVTGDIKTKTASAATMGAIVNVKKGTINGDAWFDPGQGMFVDIDNDQDMTLNITTQTTTLTGHMKRDVQMSLVDVSP